MENTWALGCFVQYEIRFDLSAISAWEKSRGIYNFFSLLPDAVYETQSDKQFTELD